MRDRRILLGILVVALLARLVALIVMSAIGFPTVAGEPWEHAENLYQGPGFAFSWYGLFSEPVVGSFIPPLYPWILTLAMQASAGREKVAVLLAQLLNVILGTLTVYLVARIAHHATGQRTAEDSGAQRNGLRADLRRIGRRPDLLAAAIWAIYPPALGHIYQPRQQTLEAFLLSLLALLLLKIAMRAGTSRDRRSPQGLATMRAILPGLVLGILLLGRPSSGLIWVFWGLFLLWQYRFRLAAWRFLVVASLMAAIVISPWMIRNWRIHDHFVPISTNGGFNFYMGNNHYSKGEIGLVHRVFRRMSAGERQEWRDLTEVERDHRFYQMGFGFWQREPGAALAGVGRKAVYFLLFRPAFFRMYPPPITVVFAISYLPLLLPCLLALRRRPSSALTLLYLALLATGLVSCIFIVSMRFRASVEPFMAVIAAHWLMERGWYRLPAVKRLGSRSPM